MSEARKSQSCPHQDQRGQHATGTFSEVRDRQGLAVGVLRPLKMEARSLLRKHSLG